MSGSKSQPGSGSPPAALANKSERGVEAPSAALRQKSGPNSALNVVGSHSSKATICATGGGSRLVDVWRSGLACARLIAAPADIRHATKKILVVFMSIVIFSVNPESRN